MEFYFVRHGLIDYGPEFLSHQTPDVPLNSEGRRQAESIKSTIEKLPIRTICVSPMIRAQETMGIIAENLTCPIVTIDELHECSGAVWNQMSLLDEANPPEKVEEMVHNFMNRAVLGMNKALQLPGPVLIVAHGGVHFAFCHHMNVEHPSKRIMHCIPVHFTLKDGTWKATLI